MCMGRSENTVQEDGLPRASKVTVSCELCGKPAALYCQADSAFLCTRCDRKIHTANFLALRHVRCILCRTCKRLTRRYVVGASRKVRLPAAVISARRGTDAEVHYRRRTKKQQPLIFL